MFQTIENIIRFIEKDELSFYLRFLEDVFSYMGKYQEIKELYPQAEIRLAQKFLSGE